MTKLTVEDFLGRLSATLGRDGELGDLAQVRDLKALLAIHTVLELFDPASPDEDNRRRITLGFEHLGDAFHHQARLFELVRPGGDGRDGA